MAFGPIYVDDAQRAEAGRLRSDGEFSIRCAADKAYAEAIARGESVEEAQRMYDEVYSCVGCL